MEKYKKTIIVRIFLLSILALLAAALGIYDTFWATGKVKANEIFEFQCGITAALGILALIWIIQYSRALRNEKELQMLYNKENDERMKAIRAKAGMPIILLSSTVMVIAGIIIGYANIVVFYTLVAAAASQLLISCITKFIYMKKI